MSRKLKTRRGGAPSAPDITTIFYYRPDIFYYQSEIFCYQSAKKGVSRKLKKRRGDAPLLEACQQQVKHVISK
jgi:hypothetical protein